MSAPAHSTPSDATLRRNIWRGLLSASSQEIHSGMDFYPGAHGLCRLFAHSHPEALASHPTHSARVNAVAGIYAALSPMNTWATNVANILDVLRHHFHARVNTTHINLWKALAIMYGADPLAVLTSSKVRSFYLGISNPNDTSPIPVDRHLICLALGRKIGSNQMLRSIVGSSSILCRIHVAYSYLGKREGIGNRLASIAWFVQRRIMSEQLPISTPPESHVHSHLGAPALCPTCAHNPPMRPHGPARFICSTCRTTRTRRNLALGMAHRPRARRPPVAHLDGYLIHADSRGRKIIYLGKGHPLANSGGWQYLSRYLCARALSRPLLPTEHAHHVTWDRTHDPDVSDPNQLHALPHYEVVSPSYHGQLHASALTLAGFRDQAGRFVEWSPEEVMARGEYSYPRDRAVMGSEAREVK